MFGLDENCAGGEEHTVGDGEAERERRNVEAADGTNVTGSGEVEGEEGMSGGRSGIDEEGDSPGDDMGENSIEAGGIGASLGDGDGAGVGIVGLSFSAVAGGAVGTSDGCDVEEDDCLRTMGLLDVTGAVPIVMPASSFGISLGETTEFLGSSSNGSSGGRGGGPSMMIEVDTVGEDGLRFRAPGSSASL